MARSDAASLSRSHARIAYDVIAPVYDDFTAHHDSSSWIAALLGELEPRGLEGDRLLDVACGTGKSFLPMLDRGWKVTACDISAPMVARARGKVGDEVEFRVADMRELPCLGEFDLVWALGDAMNYLLSREELEAALRAMRSNLAPGGLLMFDTSTLRIYRTFFATTEIVEEGDRRLVWQGQASPDVGPGQVCESRFHVEVAGEVRKAHVHRQRHFPEGAVLAALKGAGLACVDVFGHGFEGRPQRPLDPGLHTKAIFIAQIKNPPKETR